MKKMNQKDKMNNHVCISCRRKAYRPPARPGFVWPCWCGRAMRMMSSFELYQQRQQLEAKRQLEAFQTGLKYGVSALAVLGSAYLLNEARKSYGDRVYNGRVLPESAKRLVVQRNRGRNGGYIVCRGYGRSPHRIRASDVQIDHIDPYSRGGLTSLNNSQVLCGECNRKKSDHAGISERLRGRRG